MIQVYKSWIVIYPDFAASLNGRLRFTAFIVTKLLKIKISTGRFYLITIIAGKYSCWNPVVPSFEHR